MDLDTLLTICEVQVRLGFCFGILAVMATWEVRAPRRALRVAKLVRWANSLARVFLNSFPQHSHAKVLSAATPKCSCGRSVHMTEKGTA
jgi:hypothetical protein